MPRKKKSTTIVETKIDSVVYKSDEENIFVNNSCETDTTKKEDKDFNIINEKKEKVKKIRKTRKKRD